MFTINRFNMRLLIDEEIILKGKDSGFPPTDLLNTMVYAESLQKTIMSADTSKKPFTIGLFGEWGSGKSSIIKTVRDNLEKNQDVEYGFVHYDAWKYSGDSFRRMFLLELQRQLGVKPSEKLQRFYDNINEDVEVKHVTNNRYLLFVIAVLIIIFLLILFGDEAGDRWKLTIATMITFITLLLNIKKNSTDDLKVTVQKSRLFAPEQFEECFDEIIDESRKSPSLTKRFLNWVLRVDNKYDKLVIIIDNIDRCHHEMAYTLLTDIKNYLGNKHSDIVFVVPVDVDALRKHVLTLHESISILEQRHSELLRFVTGLRKKEFIVIPNLYEEETRKLLEIKGKIDSANKALIDIENRVEEESRLNDNLQNLLASSQSIVEHIKGSKCPLCGFDYEQHENLLVAISENTVLSSSLKEDIEKRNSARKDVEDIEHGLHNLLSKLTDEVEENINKTVEEIAKVKKDRENINNQLKQLLSDKIKNEATFTERFSDFKDCTEDEVRNKYEKANQNINCELNNQKSRLGHNQKELAKLIEAIDKLHEDIKKCDKTIAQLNADTFYMQYLHTAGTDNVSQYKLDDWKKQKEEVLAESVKWKKEIDDANAEISKLKEEGVDESKVISLQQRQLSFSSEYTEVKEKLTGTYNFLKTKCLMESISLPMDSDQINTVYQEAIKKSHERRSDLNDKLEVVKEYIRIIGIVGKYSENENLKKQYDVVEIKRQKYIKNKEIVDQEKTRLEKYLKDFVNGFFKLDIINKLYNTIDPHPEYKKISFECDFSLKDPRLSVLMYSEKDDHDSIVPNLYFSTAQINILSFCIFMAKALFAKTEKNEDLGCIFIDDPVQALDDINILSMIDLLRNVAFSLDKQIVITTHDKDFFELMKMKVPERLFNSRFIEFKGRGVIE